MIGPQEHEEIIEVPHSFDAILNTIKHYHRMDPKKTTSEMVNDLGKAAAFIRDNAGFLEEEEELVELAKSLECTASALGIYFHLNEVNTEPVITANERDGVR